MSRERIPADVRKLAKELAQAKPMRRGSVSGSSRCQHDQQARHGPYYSHAGRRREDAVPEQAVRQQVEAGQKFRRQLEWYWESWSSGAMLSWKLPRPPRKRRPKKGLQNGGEAVAEIEALLGTGVVDEWDFEAIETAARCMARVAARVVEQRLNADTDHAGPTLPCACGQSARYADRHGKNFESVLGPLRLERAYYYASVAKRASVRAGRWVWRVGHSLRECCAWLGWWARWSASRRATS